MKDLNARQVEILTLMGEGLTARRIGARLFLAENTVKTHQRWMYERLRARNGCHAIAIGYETGLLQPKGSEMWKVLAECRECGWTAGPGGAEIDRAAEKHVKDTRHTTVTSLREVK